MNNKGLTLLEGVGEADLNYVLEADKNLISDKNRFRRRNRRTAVGTMAAALACVVTVGAYGISQNGRATGDYQKLAREELNVEGAGGIGNFAADSIDDIVSGNPWTIDAKLDKLAVYELVNNDMEMKELAEAVEIPDQYNLVNGSDYEKAVNFAKFFIENYGDELSYENPVFAVEGGNRNTYDEGAGAKEYSVCFYEGAGTVQEQMLSYTYERSWVYFDENGNVSAIASKKADYSKKLADYPIIGADEAKELLEKGLYCSTQPYELPENAQISDKTEIMYMDNASGSYMMPYYVFYVDLTEVEEVKADLENTVEVIPEGSRYFGKYYVPAVDPVYMDSEMSAQ